MAREGNIEFIYLYIIIRIYFYLFVHPDTVITKLVAPHPLEQTKNEN